MDPVSTTPEAVAPEVVAQQIADADAVPPEAAPSPAKPQKPKSSKTKPPKAGASESKAAEAKPADVESGVTFRQLNLIEPLMAALDRAGYEHPTPIQASTIPLLLEGRDVVGQAQTGTGKTAAFALPMLQRIDMATRQPQVLVLTPTRELAIQVAKSFEGYARDMGGLRVAPVYGGQDYQVQFRLLDRGVHVIVGTPGRVMDHMRRGSIKLDALQCLVLDEADEMLRMGFA
ncbi:MAG TPA: DEAD/DEAH box helicase, partial [Pirellulales bacterium]